MGRAGQQSGLGGRTRVLTRQRASTLIELLTVVSIITFLMAILLPSLKRSMELAHATVCKANLRQVGQGLKSYSFENDGWLPMSATPSPPAGGGTSGRGREPWFRKLFPSYVGDPLALRCPKDPYGYRMVQASSRIADPLIADFASYGINKFIMTAGGGYLANMDRYPPKRPQYTILLADLGPDRIFNNKDSTTRQLRGGPSRNGSLLTWGDGFDPFSNKVTGSWVTTRHGVGIHVVTLDSAVYDVGTTNILRDPIKKHYPYCAAGDCTFCNELRLFHYSFAKDRLFWWTGSVPPR